MRDPAFQIQRSAPGTQFFFTLQGANNEPLLTSEQYTEKENAKKGIDLVRRNSQYQERFQMLKSRDGKDYFVLVAGNGEPIAVSEMYESRQGMLNGIAAVIRVAPFALVEDLS